MARVHFAKTALGLLGWVATAAFAVAGTKESVREIIRARHPIPMTAEDWLKLGPDVDRHLIKAADDTALLYGARQRAISGLAVIGGPQAKAFLREMTGRSRLAPELRASALRAYAHGFSKTDPMDVQLVSVPMTNDPSWVVRLGAVRALDELGTKEALEALRSLEKEEKHPSVQIALRDALSPLKIEKR